jgi:uncharacterized protein YndB with AHSA1/START domain
MSAANRSSFVYVTVIRTTPEKLWEALTDAKLIRRYWFDAIVECDWNKGSAWRKSRGDGSLTDTGEILEFDPPRRMVIRWQGEWQPEFKAEGPSRCTLALEPMDGAVKLTSTHEIERPESKFIAALSEGWPLVLSNLKSLLETGEVAITAPRGALELRRHKRATSRVAFTLNQYRGHDTSADGQRPHRCRRPQGCDRVLR